MPLTENIIATKVEWKSIRDYLQWEINPYFIATIIEESHHQKGSLPCLIACIETKASEVPIISQTCQTEKEAKEFIYKSLPILFTL